MKKYILYLLILTLLVFNVKLLINIKNLENKYSKQSSIVSKLELSIDVIENSMLQGQINNNLLLDGELQLLDENDNKYNLKEFLSSGTKLVICSTETGCNVCIENELELIKKYQTAIGIDNIIAFTKYNNSRKLKIFKKANSIDFQAFYANNLSLPFEKEYDQPFVFIVDSTLQVKHFFVPNTIVPNLSESYYSSICERYFSQCTDL